MSKTSKKIEEYWEDRIRAEIEARKASDRSFAQEMTRLHDYHFKAIETEIEAFINRYAVKNNLTKQEALKRVEDFDVQAFATKAKKYVEEKDFSAQANAELALYNLKMKVNRLELLEYQLDLELLALAEGERQLTAKFLRDGFLSTAQLQAGILGQSVGSLTHELETIINHPFHGVTWSDNIWQRQTELRKLVAGGVEKLILRGHSPLELVPELRRQFEVSSYAARRLAITESARIQTEVQKLSLEKAGFTKYRISHEDKRWEANGSACDICKRFISDSYDVKGMVAGVTAPPFHPFCRCAAVPEMGEGESLQELDNSTLDESDGFSRLYRNKDPNKRKSVNIVRQNKLTKSFRDRGGIIWQNAESERYLDERKASAMNLNADTIVLRPKATISEILEELYHAEQWQDGRLNPNDEVSKIKAEIEAQHYLLSVEKRYNIPKVETKQTKQNLKYWEEELKKHED